jgi:hypothetical protein
LFLGYGPQFPDLAVPTLIYILRDAAPSRALAIALFFSHLMNTPTVQNVLIALMLANQWNSISAQLLIRFSREPHNILISFAILEVFDLTSRYVNYLNRLDPIKETVIDELM